MNNIFESPNCPKFTATPSLTGGVSYVLTLSPNGWTYNPIKLEKPSKGNGEFGIGLNLVIPCDSIPSNVTWKNCTGTSGYNGVIGLCKVAPDVIVDPEHPCDPRSSNYYHLRNPHPLKVRDYSNDGNSENYGVSYPPIEVRPGNYRFYYIEYLTSYSKSSPPSTSQIKFYPLNLPALQQNDMGGVYQVTVATKSKQDTELLATTETLVKHNDVSILWQIPQYVIITAGEVLFSVTGLEFAYSEASPQLKSVVQALWLFTTAIGDLIVVVIITLNLFSDVAVQMFVFGGIMLVVIGVFILLAVFYYEYADYANEADGLSDEEAFDKL
uniref:Uncharacterized protein n=1 Tax=Caenorhabditis japonica TaxID=281687 RepID=A0A8R1J180_CAEJA